MSYQDIPRIYTAIAEWGACMVYLYMLKRENMKSARFLIGALLMLAVQCMFLTVTGNVSEIFWIPCMLIAVSMMYLFLLNGGGMNPLGAGYCCARAFVLAEFVASLQWQLVSILQVQGIQSDWIEIFITMVVFGGCFVIDIYLEKDFLKQDYQDSLDLIQMKYHDLKHQITALRAESDEEKRKKWIDAMEEELSVFENMSKTGNQVLDTILAAKIFHCRKNHIQITCVADGKVLDFMHVIDLCSVFGNALDNAIEHVIMIPEEEKRLIHLTVSAKKGFAFIKIENYCEDNIQKNENDLIITTKAEQKNHGFGLKSIRTVVEKYNGSMDFGVEQNWFELKILLPRAL